MKKIKIYKQIRVAGVKYKQAIEAEPVIDSNLAIYKDEETGGGVILDIKTGLSVAQGKWRKGAIDAFNIFCAKDYYNFIQTNAYEKIINDFNQLEEYHPEVTFDDTESELDNED